MCQNGKYHEESGKNQSYLKLKRVTAVLLFRVSRQVFGTSLTGMDEPRDNSSYHRHYQQIRIDRHKNLSAKDQNQYHKAQKHHADCKQHGSYILVRLLCRSFPALARQHRNGSGTTIQSADNTGNQHSRFMKHISL